MTNGQRPTTSAELAVLSLVAEQPRHGYEIEKVIQERGMREWTEVGFSSIYYLLKKLEKKGWLSSAPGEQAGRGPAPKIYRLTPSGDVAWQEAALKALSEPRSCYPPILIGLANLPALEPDKSQAALEAHRKALEERLDRVRARAADQAPLPDHVTLIFDYSLAMIAAELQWLKTTIQKGVKHDQS